MAEPKGNQPLKDWVYIEELFRSGHSYRSIRYYYLQKYPDQTLAIETVRRQAIKRKWKRDLKAKIKKAADRKIAEQSRDEPLTQEADEPEGRSDDEIIDEAAELAARVVISHRQDGKALRKLVRKFSEELNTNPRQVVMRKTSEGTDKIEIPLPFKEKTRSLKDLSFALAKAVTIERISHNLDDKQHLGTGTFEIYTSVPDPNLLPEGI